MNRCRVNILAVLILFAALLSVTTAHGGTAPGAVLRFGYLDVPGSRLCRTAATHGHFSEEGLQVKLVRFESSAAGLAALAAGAVDVGAFGVADTLRAIAGGKGFRIIAGGGTPEAGNLSQQKHGGISLPTEQHDGVVVLIAADWPFSEKGTLIQLTAALIRAYHTEYQQVATPLPETRITFDPNPDYWRLERIWHSLGLQHATMKRDFLARHVYEEIYCDALDRLLLGETDAVLQELFSKAICTPNCCPASAAKP